MLGELDLLSRVPVRSLKLGRDLWKLSSAGFHLGLGSGCIPGELHKRENPTLRDEKDHRHNAYACFELEN